MWEHGNVGLGRRPSEKEETKQESKRVHKMDVAMV
jgi:hypothetical protein